MFCGIPALIHSYKVIEDIDSGDLVKARRHSNISRKLNMYAAFVILLMIALLLMAFFVFPDETIQMMRNLD